MEHCDFQYQIFEYIESYKTIFNISSSFINDNKIIWIKGKKEYTLHISFQNNFFISFYFKNQSSYIYFAQFSYKVKLEWCQFIKSFALI